MTPAWVALQERNLNPVTFRDLLRNEEGKGSIQLVMLGDILVGGMGLPWGRAV